MKMQKAYILLIWPNKKKNKKDSDVHEMENEKLIGCGNSCVPGDFIVAALHKFVNHCNKFGLGCKISWLWVFDS